MANRGNVKTGTDFLFLGSKITAGGNRSHNSKRRFLLGRIMTNPWRESRSVVSDSLQPHGILQARILEWVAFPFPRVSSQPRDRTQVSCIAGRLSTREVRDNPRQHIKKQRCHFADKGTYTQNYSFFVSHVQLWELDHTEGWAPKNWCFWTVVLKKTLESLLDCKEIKLVNP